MNRLKLHIPTENELEYRRRLISYEDTMAYNMGYGDNGGCENTIKMTLIATPGGKVRLVKEIQKNKYEKGADKKCVAYLCTDCGHIDFWAEEIK